ncbi:MAG: hypothetical protein LUE25_04540 [Clostridiales bacterium]|nr:hypothetical protein [Clostridiales bacterium]
MKYSRESARNEMLTEKRLILEKWGVLRLAEMLNFKKACNEARFVVKYSGRRRYAVG